MNQNTRESILIVNNTEWMWLELKEIETITALAEFFRVHVAPKVRSSVDPDTYTLHDIDLADFLDNTEHKIGKE